MPDALPRQDAVVIGGGFYGVCIAAYLGQRRGLGKVLLVEQASGLCQRASLVNQARVHNGYHYPRSFTTAYRSRVNFPAFLSRWPSAVRRDFTALYAIARRNSKVTARQFERFCREIGAPLAEASEAQRRLFDPRLVEQVYSVTECAFDARDLVAWAGEALDEAGVEVLLSTRANGIVRAPEGGLVLALGDGREVVAAQVFNCTYSGLNQLGGDFPGIQAGLKHEITEMALVELPDRLAGLAITVMDGPFFSLMPYPARGLHTLSHVRYTPHLHWTDRPGEDPYRRLAEYHRQSRADRMLRDAARYLPAIAEARVVDSLFEVKTVLTRSEGDDGRPILLERHRDLPGLHSVLGGKIDNVFDVLEALDAELPGSGALAEGAQGG